MRRLFIIRKDLHLSAGKLGAMVAHLFDAAVEEIVIQRMIEVEVSCVSNKIEKLCNKNCNDCKLRLSA